jgi:hypothetical protein
MMRARNGHGLHTSPVLYLEALARCLSEKNLYSELTCKHVDLQPGCTDSLFPSPANTLVLP